jgi:hypothetical protein
LVAAGKAGYGKAETQGLAYAALLTPWMIWKHRNKCIFKGAQPSICVVVAKIKKEATL